MVRGGGESRVPAEVGTATTVARQWLHSLRAGRQTDPAWAACGPSRSATAIPHPSSSRHLQAAYAGGGRPQVQNRRPPDRALERIEQRYQAREVTGGQPLDGAQAAREVQVSEHYVRGTLAALRGGTLTSAQRIERLWAAVGGRGWPAARRR